MPIALAIAGAAVIGGGASIIASNKASSTAKQISTDNNRIAQEQAAQGRAGLEPYAQAGNAVTPTIQGLLGLGDKAASDKAFETYKGSTEYQSRLAEGERSVTAALGSRGLLESGAAQKSLLKYGQTFASNEFGTYLGNLTGQQQVGLTAASAQAGIGQGLANTVSANNTAAGNTSANAALSNASTINSALGNLVSAYGYSQGLGSSYGRPGGGAGGGAPGPWGTPGRMGF